MEIEKLVGFATALLMVGLVCGVGTLILDKFANAVTVSQTIENENSTVVASGLTSTTNKYVTELTGCMDAVNKTKFTIGSTCNYTNLNDPDVKLVIKVQGTGATAVNTAYLLTNYTYKYDSKTSDILQAGRDGVDDVNNDWLSLVTTIAILSIILGLTVVGFSYYRNRD